MQALMGKGVQYDRRAPFQNTRPPKSMGFIKGSFNWISFLRFSIQILVTLSPLPSIIFLFLPIFDGHGQAYKSAICEHVALSPYLCM